MVYNRSLMRIFFAGPLTDLKEKDKTKAFYKKLANIAEKNDYLYFWAFLNGTDPDLNPEIPPADVFKRDLYELGKSDVMVAYVGEPSTGTGQEIEFALSNHIPVYLLYEKGKQITRMVLGSPNIAGRIEFIDETDALEQFDALLQKLKK